jgi:hypothetical protein
MVSAAESLTANVWDGRGIWLQRQVGPPSWKRFPQQPQVRITQIQPEGQDVRIRGNADDPQSPKHAFLGVRASELAASPFRIVASRAISTKACCTELRLLHLVRDAFPEADD